MSWRPEGWQNPYIYHNLEAKPIGMGIDYANVPEMVAYERGADAMLEALKARARRIAESPVLIEEHLIQASGNGTWVFIPDDEKERSK